VFCEPLARWCCRHVPAVCVCVCVMMATGHGDSLYVVVLCALLLAYSPPPCEQGGSPTWACCTCCRLQCRPGAPGAPGVPGAAWVRGGRCDTGTLGGAWPKPCRWWGRACLPWPLSWPPPSATHCSGAGGLLQRVSTHPEGCAAVGRLSLRRPVGRQALKLVSVVLAVATAKAGCTAVAQSHSVGLGRVAWMRARSQGRYRG
jgi:hypothetical protein